MRRAWLRDEVREGTLEVRVRLGDEEDGRCLRTDGDLGVEGPHGELEDLGGHLAAIVNRLLGAAILRATLAVDHDERDAVGDLG